MTPLRTRESITWRIPIELLEELDELRAKTGQDRTAVVVEALQSYVKRAKRRAR
jgi:metal-responsive CopG/Arc/MetJ family transcriptional regulator